MHSVSVATTARGAAQFLSTEQSCRTRRSAQDVRRDEAERPAQPVDRGHVEEGADQTSVWQLCRSAQWQRDGVDKLDDALG